MPSFDTIIIGGGTNGLACAGKLALAGQKVLVLEGADRLGGAAATLGKWEGYRKPGLAHLLTSLDKRVVSAMALADHGLAYADSNVTSTALCATGDHLTLAGPVGKTISGSLPEADGKAWSAIRARLMRFAATLAPMREMAPPRIARDKHNQYLRLAKIGVDLRRLGRDEFREFLRLALINIADVLEDDLTDARLSGLVAFDTVLGAWMGPRSPNSLMLYLNRLAGGIDAIQGAIALPKGGMGTVVDAMIRSVEATGVSIRDNAKVARIIVEGDRAVGVSLASGEELMAPRIVSAINPRTTFLELLGPRHADTEFLNRTRNIRSRGGAAKLHLALTGTPDFRGADLKSRLVIAPSIRAVEDAFNAVKYGEVPARPVMEIIIPSAFEAGHAPDGHHTLSAIIQFAPHKPLAGNDAARQEMLDNTLEQLEAHAPGIRALIAKSEMLMPYDIETHYGLVGGNWHHGEMAVEQMLFLRPFPAAAQYSTPIDGLFLAGAGSHPGGGVSGTPGWNAAERILKGAAT